MYFNLLLDMQGHKIRLIEICFGLGHLSNILCGFCFFLATLKPYKSSKKKIEFFASIKIPTTEDFLFLIR
jgi:hypothetical protein